MGCIDLRKSCASVGAQLDQGPPGAIDSQSSHDQSINTLAEQEYRSGILIPQDKGDVQFPPCHETRCVTYVSVRTCFNWGAKEKSYCAKFLIMGCATK